MDRRNFGKALFGGVAGTVVAGAGAMAAGLPVLAQKITGKLGPGQVFPDLKVKQNPKLKLGGDYHSVAGKDPTDKTSLEFFLRFGAKNVTITASNNLAKSIGGTPHPEERGLEELGPWDLDVMKRMQDDCRNRDMLLECVRMDSAYIIMRSMEDRRRWLDKLKDNIRKCKEAGIPSISYHWTMIPQQRNKTAVIRGGATHNGFTLDPNWRNLPVGPAGNVSGEEYWDRIEFFLRDIIPVARENKVKMSLHPFDPGGLPAGYLGTTNYNSDFGPGLKRYEQIVDDPHNAFSFCCGVAGEAYKNPNDQLPIFRYLVERKKVTQVHMRNIIGGQNDFQEVYPDMGDTNFMNLVRVLRDLSYDGTILPDHAPSHPDDPKKLQAYGFANGYLLGLIRAANEEAKLITG